MKYFFLLCMLFSSVIAFDGLTLSTNHVKNGESLFVHYQGSDNIQALSMSVNEKSFPFYTHKTKDNSFYALIPFHYNNPLGEIKLTFNYKKAGEHKSVELDPIYLVWGNYRKEYLKVDSAKIKLSKKDEIRVEKEYLEAMELYAKESEPFLPLKSLENPSKSKITSRFGNERLFNGTRKSYHSGVDYRAKRGSPVFAVGRGIVVLVQKRFYAGGSVILDHGEGIFSCYYHLSKSLVKVGDVVEAKQKIGLSGSTGRTTGPHLHFSMKLHGVTINPLVLIKQLNRFIEDKL